MSRKFVIYKDAISSLPNHHQGGVLTPQLQILRRVCVECSLIIVKELTVQPYGTMVKKQRTQNEEFFRRSSKILSFEFVF
jgi:hypothetical protein